MKAGWEVKPLADLCEVKNGYAFKSKLFSDSDGIQIIRIRDLKDGYKTVKRYTGEYSEEYICRAGDFLIGMDGEFVCYEWKGEDSLLNQRVCRLEGFSRNLSPRFMFYGINKYLKEIEDVTGYTTVKHISSKTIKGIEFPVPPLEEQKRIVAVLDAAFEGLDRARAHVEANLQSARDLFEAYLKSIFNNHSNKWQAKEYTDKSSVDASVGSPTKGRAASTRHIKGDYGLSVLLPSVSARSGWRWTLLSELARMESGHTPSRRKPSFWGGTIPWIGIKDARNHHGERISKTLECATQAGIDNSSSRLLPKNTVCLSRTASVGYVTIMDREMATSQDFVNWVCGDKLVPDFLKLVLLAQGKELSKFSSGSIHQTIYFPEAKGFAICHPDTSVQKEIVATASKVSENSIRLILKYQAKLTDLDDLRQSLLQKAFAGELT